MMRTLAGRILGSTAALVTMVSMGVGGAAVLGGSPAAAAANSGPEHITIIETNGTGPAVFTGLFTDTGTDTTGNNNTDVFQLGMGSITVGHHSTVNGGTFHLSSNCVATITDRGDFQVKSGTGAYSTLQGHGTYTLTGTLIFPVVNGQCDTHAVPTVVTVVHANGAFHFTTTG